MKSKILALLVSLLFAHSIYAQFNCNLINSATFTVPNDTVVKVRLSALWYTISPTAFVDVNNWHQLVYTKDFNNGKLFIDGHLISTIQWGPYAFNWYQLYIGAAKYIGIDSYFKGWLDELRISNMVRSDSEIIANYQQGVPLSLDANTISLWHFDETAGSTFSNSAIPGSPGTLINGAVFQPGVFGNCVYFDGVDDYGDCNFDMPENNITIELWIKLNGYPDNSGGIRRSFLCPYGLYNAEFALVNDTLINNYTWSTGDTGTTVTVDPSQLPYLWVTDGNCTDTIFFNSQSATIYDTVTTFIAVTDTLIIDAQLTGIPAPNNINTLKIYPNPASTHIYIDNGNFASMNGYSIEIRNSAGALVYGSLINQQQFYIDLSTWSGNGTYFVRIFDSTGGLIATKKIIIQ